LRVLLVDDDRILITAYERSLKGLRPAWQVQTATSGKEAMRLMERETIDVLVTDIVMPGVDGVDLLNWTEYHLPRILRIVVSGTLDGRTLIETRALAKVHLVKPFAADVLVERIEGLLAPRPVLIHIVDDSAHDRGVIQALLAKALPTARFEPFPDGSSFLERLASDPTRPDLLILDVKMPVLGGLDVLRALANAREKAFAIVVFSSEGVSFEMPECEKLGANACLYKPASYAEYGVLVQVVEGLLRRRGLIR
jgi:CheY-like chemotaxis protein